MSRCVPFDRRRVWQQAAPSREQQREPHQPPSPEGFVCVQPQQQQQQQHVQPHQWLQQRQQQVHVVQPQYLFPHHSFPLQRESQGMQNIFSTPADLQGCPRFSTLPSSQESPALSLSHARAFPQQQQRLVAPVSAIPPVLYGSSGAAPPYNAALLPSYAFAPAAVPSWQRGECSLSYTTAPRNTSSAGEPPSVYHGRGSSRYLWLRGGTTGGKPAIYMYSCSGVARSSAAAASGPGSAEATSTAALASGGRAAALGPGRREEATQVSECTDEAGCTAASAVAAAARPSAPPSARWAVTTATATAAAPAVVTATRNTKANAAAVVCTAAVAEGAAPRGTAAAANPDFEDPAACSESSVILQLVNVAAAHAAPADREAAVAPAIAMAPATAAAPVTSAAPATVAARAAAAAHATAAAPATSAAAAERKTLTTQSRRSDSPSKRLNNAQPIHQAAAYNTDKTSTDNKYAAGRNVTGARAAAASAGVHGAAASSVCSATTATASAAVANAEETPRGGRATAQLPARGIDAAFSLCETPTPICATPPSPAAAHAVPVRSFAVAAAHGTVRPPSPATALAVHVRSFAVAAAHGTVRPSWGMTPSVVLPPRLVTAEGPRAATAAATPAARAATSTSSSSRTAARDGTQTTALEQRLLLQQRGGATKTGAARSRLMPRLLQPQADYTLQQLHQQVPKQRQLLRLAAVGRPSGVFQQLQQQSRLQREAAREEDRPVVAWQEERAPRRKGLASRDYDRHIVNREIKAVPGAVMSEDGITAGRRTNEDACEACCSKLWAISPADLFSLDITAVCQKPAAALGSAAVAAAVAAVQQERRRAEFGSALKQLLDAEGEAQQLLQAAQEKHAGRRSCVLTEVETAEQAYRASCEEAWKVKKKAFEEETAGVNAQLEKQVDMQLHADTEGLDERRSKAGAFIIEKVMEVDTSCPLEAVKRFASPRRQLAFYAARVGQEQQVIHHPPGDRLRMEKDVIIWDDEGYAKVEHMSAHMKTASVTQLGSFWVRHQSKAQQHSDRPLVLLSTQLLPGEQPDAEEEGSGEGEMQTGEDAKAAGQKPYFPPLRSLSEVRSSPAQSRSFIARGGSLQEPLKKNGDSLELQALPSRLREDLRSFSQHDAAPEAKK